MRKYLIIAMTIVLVFGAIVAVAPVAAQEMDPAAVVEALYAAVEAQDLDTAGAFLAEDVVLVLIPPPPGTNGVFVGKDAVLGWYENLIGNNFAIELSDAEVAGDRVTITNRTWVDDLPIAPVVFDGTGIVQDGLVKTMSWIVTPESMAELDTAFAEAANETAVRRYMEELWNEGNLDVADEVLAEDFISNNYPADGDVAAMKEAVAGFRAENPRAYFPIEELIMTDDKAIIINHMWEIPEGAPEGAEGEPVSPPMVLVLGVEDGKITERTLFFLAE